MSASPPPSDRHSNNESTYDDLLGDFGEAQAPLAGDEDFDLSPAVTPKESQIPKEETVQEEKEVEEEPAIIHDISDDEMEDDVKNEIINALIEEREEEKAELEARAEMEREARQEADGIAAGDVEPMDEGKEQEASPELERVSPLGEGEVSPGDSSDDEEEARTFIEKDLSIDRLEAGNEDEEIDLTQRADEPVGAADDNDEDKENILRADQMEMNDDQVVPAVQVTACADLVEEEIEEKEEMQEQQDDEKKDDQKEVVSKEQDLEEISLEQEVKSSPDVVLREEMAIEDDEKERACIAYEEEEDKEEDSDREVDEEDEVRYIPPQVEIPDKIVSKLTSYGNKWRLLQFCSIYR